MSNTHLEEDEIKDIVKGIDNVGSGTINYTGIHFRVNFEILIFFFLSKIVQ